MSSPRTSGAPAFGRVHRAGAQLVISVPEEMSEPSRRTLEQELVLFANAEISPAGEAHVPVDQAHQLEAILSRPWPAGRWPWQWAEPARDAAEAANSTHERFLRVLRSSEPTRSEIDVVLGSLVNTGFSRTLLPAQEVAVAKLAHAEGGGNFSVPGSGKTTMTFATYVALRAQGVVDRMLVIAPQSAYDAWVEEARDCFTPDSRPIVEVTPSVPRRSTEVVVLNYERGAQSATRAAVDGWARGHRVLVVFDEAHRAKRGHQGEHGRGALDLADLAERRLVLTGTPMPNSADDLAAVLELAWPGHGTQLASPETPGAEKSWVRITKDQLGLAPAHVTVTPVRLDDNHRQVYQALTRDLRSSGERLATAPELASRAVARLVAAASNPALLLSDDNNRELAWQDLPAGEMSDAALVAHLTSSVRPEKLLACAAIAHEHAARGEKLLIWTNFVGNVGELSRLLAPLNPAAITGALPRDDSSAPTDRSRELRKFRDDASCSVLIATPQTLGEGVSLHHTCQSQVHLDRTFNAGLFLQSLDRTHRVGMPPGTAARVTILVASGTIDEAIHSSLSAKLIAMDERLRDPTLLRLTQASTEKRTLSRDDINALLNHLREAGA